MATPPSDDSVMLFKLLADGQWHPYEEIRDRLAATVPPGRALRKYQERVEYARRYKQDPDYDTDADEDTRIYFGGRACAQIAITSWKGRGLMVTGEGPKKQIRIKPGFKSWGIEDVPEVENRDVVPPIRGEKAPEDEGVPEVPGEIGGEAQREHGGPLETLKNYQWLCPRCSYMNSGAVCTHCGVLLADSARMVEQPEEEELFPNFAEEDRVPAPDYAEPVLREEALIETAESVQVLAVETEAEEPEEEIEDAPKLRELAGNQRRYTRTAEEDGYGWPTMTPVTDSYSECEACGQLVMDTQRHAEWHQGLEAKMASEGRQDMALFAESEIRDLIAEVVADALDHFQVNMVDYLSTQFAQLETMIWRQQRAKNNPRFGP